MNINNIITEIEKVDTEVYERLDTRRNAMRQFAGIGGKIALTAVPILFGGMLKKAYGQTNSGTMKIIDVLNFALTLEYLESEFYIRGVASEGLIPAGRDTKSITIIRDHEIEHVAFLKTAIKSLGGTPVSKPSFDFTAGNGSHNGPFRGVFINYTIFLQLAQTFEDTGVRAYKGQAANLMSNNDVLTYALDIHSVEARHASHIRTMRRGMTNDRSIKSWITGRQTGAIGDAVQANYDGEENTIQGGVEITHINGYPIDRDAATESFDEPLTKQEILKLVNPFIVPQS